MLVILFSVCGAQSFISTTISSTGNITDHVFKFNLKLPPLMFTKFEFDKLTIFKFLSTAFCKLESV